MCYLQARGRLTDDHGLPEAGRDPDVKSDIVGDNGERIGRV